MKNFLLKNDYFLNILYWLLIFMTFLLQVVPQTGSIPESILFTALLIGTIYPVSTFLSKNLLLNAMREKKLKKFILQFFLFSVIVGSTMAFYIIMFRYLEEIDIFPQSSYFNWHDVSGYPILVVISAGIVINLSICGLRFLIEYFKLREVHLKAQLQILQQQINPHFMFNVLNHIHILMQKNVGLASDLLVKYSEILRYQLYNGKKESVTLNEEIQFLKDVIEVEKIRWGDDLKVNCRWDIENGDKTIQPLLLITFIENAFKHVSRSITEKGYLNVEVKQKNNSLYMEVENSKSKQQTVKKDASGLGLANIRERLQILYPLKHKLDIEENESVYKTRLSITL